MATQNRLKALLVVDAQRDFCPGGALAVNGGDEIMAPIAELIRSGKYDIIVASQDWHPPSHMSFARNYEDKHVFEKITLPNGQEQMLWPAHCVQDTNGAEFHRQLLLLYQKAHHIALKGQNPAVDSYSAFFDNDHKSETTLRAFLQEKAQERTEGGLENIDLDVCGLAFDYCVKASAIDAAKLGMKTRVLINLTRAVDERNTLEIARELTRHGVDIAHERPIQEKEVTRARVQELRA